MAGVIFDTSALIHFAASNKPYWQVARSYYQACLTLKIPMYLSSIVAGEFEIRQSIADLPIQSFRILGYELPHAIKAAHLFRLNERYDTNEHGDTRRIIINDLKILAQAEEENIACIVSADHRTLAKMADRLQRDGLSVTRVLILADGFDGQRLALSQGDMQMPLIESNDL